MLEFQLTMYYFKLLGCGNGQAAFAFRDEGYNDITGVDYSESAIELSNKIARKSNAESIIFKVCNESWIKKNWLDWSTTLGNQ